MKTVLTLAVSTNWFTFIHKVYAHSCGSFPLVAGGIQEKAVKVSKEESLHNMHHLLFKVTVWAWSLSNCHGQVRWEQWKVVALHV